MKLSTKGRYAARAMLDLALHYGNGPVSLKDVAQRQQISDRYLENLMVPMVSSGLVVSSRGKGGGFALARNPDGIRLLEVISNVEGSLAPVQCVDDPEKCSRSAGCVTSEIWQMLGDAIVEVLGSVTLEDMVMRHRRKASDHQDLMYYI